MAEEDEYGMVVRSASEKTEIQWDFGEDTLKFDLTIPMDCGPRAGIQMDLNILDLPDRTDWKYQCMPKIIEVDETFQYAYFVFSTSDDRYLTVAVNSPLAAWRIKYSYAGHRMTGFQLLTQADDVVTGGRTTLPAVEHLSVSMMFGDSCQECLEKLADSMQLAIVQAPISGGFPGTELPVRMLGDSVSVTVKAPDGEESVCGQTVQLTQEGIYQIKSVSAAGYSHTSRVLCHAEWETIFDKVNRFYRDHFQDKSGAFYRIIWADTLTAGEGRNYESSAFGKPEEIGSCRTGEFGGFAAWAMIKNQQLFGKKEEFSESIRTYIEHWALNRGHEDTSYYSTVYKKAQNFMGREYGPYHFYQEYNYPQHEVFLMEELADYYKICKDPDILQDAVKLAEHFMEEHIQEEGMVVCENHPGKIIDYSTVHATVCGFIRLAELLKEKDREKSQAFMQQAEKIADYVCRRGLAFPTEGEPCTEDGSMACSVITLLWAYIHIGSKAEYLETAERILHSHRMLVLDGTDCRMKNSSLRFWETQYETRDWGPSINVGHAWTIWGAEAMALMALIKCDISLLKDSYEGGLLRIFVK